MQGSKIKDSGVLTTPRQHETHIYCSKEASRIYCSVEISCLYMHVYVRQNKQYLKLIDIIDVVERQDILICKP